ncbi:MAG: glycosyltransferase family 4 protein [Candidatus Bathyarchaeia archaeon]
MVAKKYRVAVLAWEKPSRDHASTGSGVYLGYLGELGKLSKERGNGIDLTFIVPWEEDLFLKMNGYKILFLKIRRFSRARPYGRDVLYPACRNLTDRLLGDRFPIDLKRFDLIFASGYAFGNFISKAQYLENLVYVSHSPEFLRGSIARRRKFFGGSDEYLDRFRRNAELEALALKGSKQVITVSKACKRELTRHYRLGQNKVSVIYNGVDTSLFRRVPLRRSRDKTIFTYVGRAHPEKGTSLLLQSTKELMTRDPKKDFELQMVTDGGSSLQRVVKRVGLTGHTRLMRWRGYQRLPRHYSAATFSIMPSYWDSFSYSVAESLSCETPVIASSSGGLPEIVDDEVGLLFQAGDKEDLIVQLEKACDFPLERVMEMGRHGRRRIQSLFSRERFLTNYMRFIEQNMKGNFTQSSLAED